MPSPYLRMVNIPLDQWRYELKIEPKIVGRGAEVPIPPEHRGVSRRHAAVWREGESCYVQDLGSRGGTRINGVCIPKQRPVQIVPGDAIALYDVELRLQSGSTAKRSLASPPVDGQVDPSATGCLSSFTVDLHSSLSARELEIVLWMRRGLVDDKQLGEALHRSRHTIRTQVGSILKKLRLRSRAAITVPSMIALEAERILSQTLTSSTGASETPSPPADPPGRAV